MSDLKFKFSDEAKPVFFRPSTTIVYFDDKEAPTLERLAPGDRHSIRRRLSKNRRSPRRATKTNSLP